MKYNDFTAYWSVLHENCRPPPSQDVLKTRNSILDLGLVIEFSQFFNVIRLKANYCSI